MPEPQKPIPALPANIRRKALTPEQQRLRDELDRRTAGIQAAKLKPPDGVTFGKGKA